MRRMVLAGSAAFVLAGCGQASETDGSPDELAESDATAVAVPVETGRAGQEAQPDDPASADQVRAVACAADEQELFSCTAGSKRIAVCGVTNAQGQKTAQYRFGTPEEAEIVLDGGRFANVPYSGGGEAQIAFANGATRYIVYSRTVRTNFTAGEPNNPEFTDGVMVLRNGETIADRQCTGDVESVDVMAGDSFGGVANELFHYAD